MYSRHFWLMVVGLGLVIALLLVFLIVVPAKAPAEKNINLVVPSASPVVSPTSPPEIGIPDLLVVTYPLTGTMVKSPLVITGRARGSWFFEASAPVRILDAHGKELGVVPAQTEGNWMTTDFVNFSAILSFKTPTTATGTLVFEKDNPSGLPQNDKKFEMIVRFK